MTKIIFDLEEFKSWIETIGCSCCHQGWLHMIGGDLIYDWESNIQYVITKHRDIELEGELMD